MKKNNLNIVSMLSSDVEYAEMLLSNPEVLLEALAMSAAYNLRSVVDVLTSGRASLGEDGTIFLGITTHNFKSHRG